MSLVAYDASSDEEEEEKEEDHLQLPQPQPQPQSQPKPQPQQIPSSTAATSTKSSRDQKQQDIPSMLPSPFEKLPDASLLLNSPMVSQSVGMDHSSRVAAAMAENASRKREANGSSTSSLVRSKIPRGNLPHTKTIPDTGSGSLLVPPQLSGRSNVVTEDITKLFVKKNAQGKS